MPHQHDGFPGQRLAVLPRPVVSEWLENEPLLALLPSDVGFFPQAQWHFFERRQGISQLVLIYCLHGEGWLEIGASRWRVQGGQAIAILPGVAHAYGASIDDPWTIYWVHMAGEKVAQVARLLGVERSKPLFDPGYDLSLPPLYEAMIAQLSRGYTPTILLEVSLLLAQLVARLLPTQAKEAASSVASRIERVLLSLEQNLSAHVCVANLAAQANLSPSHFSALFKRQTGFSVLDYFMRLKMQRAAHLLDSSALPIKVIAAELGFDDPLYFSRSFRRIHNCSPSEYRAIQKG